MTRIAKARLATLMPGDTWIYDADICTPAGRSFGTCVGRWELPEMQDHYGNPCRMLSQSYSFGETEFTLMLYLSQDQDGSLHGHASQWPPDSPGWVKEPAEGSFVFLRSPLVVGDSTRTCFENVKGVHMAWSFEVEGTESISVPAGDFLTYRVQCCLEEPPEDMMRITMWLVPELGWAAKMTWSARNMSTELSLTSMSRLVTVCPRISDR